MPGKAPEKAREEPKRRWNIQHRDPDAMDVDAVTTEKRGEWMKKGLCFNCNKPGHSADFAQTNGGQPPQQLPPQHPLPRLTLPIHQRR